MRAVGSSFDAVAAGVFDVAAVVLVEGVVELLVGVSDGDAELHVKGVFAVGLWEHGCVAVFECDGAVPEVGVGVVVGSGAEVVVVAVA